MEARCIYPAATRGIVPTAVGMCPAMTRGVFSCLGSGEEKLGEKAVLPGKLAAVFQHAPIHYRSTV